MIQIDLFNFWRSSLTTQGFTTQQIYMNTTQAFTGRTFIDLDRIYIDLFTGRTFQIQIYSVIFTTHNSIQPWINSDCSCHAPPDFFFFFSKSCSFQAILRGKPLFWANFGLRSLGVKSPSAPDQNPGPGQGTLGRGSKLSTQTRNCQLSPHAGIQISFEIWHKRNADEWAVLFLKIFRRTPPPKNKKETDLIRQANNLSQLHHTKNVTLWSHCRRGTLL